MLNIFYFKVVIMLAKIAKNIVYFNRISTARACLLKAEGLAEYGYYQDALIEAKKARDSKDASSYEIKIAKGKIIDILKNIEQEKQISHSPANKS